LRESAGVSLQEGGMPKKPYEERTDLEKCQSQWTKLKGLHTREEWSAAIVRAATAAEIAANFAIRQELKKQSTISGDCANSLLRWANGLSGKINRLLTPLTKGTKRGKRISKLKAVAAKINDTRNDVVHRGEFRDEDEATEIIVATKKFVEGLVRIYEPQFALRDKKANS